MTVAAATNCWTHALETIAQGLAACPTFQTMVGATGDATAAAALVLGRKLRQAWNGQYYTLEQLQELGAYAQLFSAPNAPYGKRRRSLSSGFEPYGQAVVCLARLVPEADLQASDADTSRADELDREWEILCGDVIDELIAWLAENAGPVVQDVAVIVVDETADKRQPTHGCWQGCDLAITWGRQGA